VACQLTAELRPASNQARPAAQSHDLDSPRDRVGEGDGHSDWAAGETTHQLDAKGVPAEQGTAIAGDR
jgi:hypothetical protein